MQWEFDNNSSPGALPVWTPCASEMEKHLNALVAANKTSDRVYVGRFEYLLELMPNMQQTNIRTGRSRALRLAQNQQGVYGHQLLPQHQQMQSIHGHMQAAISYESSPYSSYPYSTPFYNVQYPIRVESPPMLTSAAAVKSSRREKRKASRSMREDDLSEVVYSGQRQSDTVNHHHVWERMEFMKSKDLPANEHCHICLLEFVDEDSNNGSSTDHLPKGGGDSGVEFVSSNKNGRSDSKEEEKEEVLDCIKLPNCHGHYFHAECIQKWFELKPKCPSCGHFYGEEIGTQPLEGTMLSQKSPSSLPGYPDCGSIEISYHFPDGTQGPEHPSPGERYFGTSRSAYLPDNEQGRKCLKLLQQAFRNRVCFTVGTSLTTNRSNVVIWNGIHHKTSRGGGPTCFGYPDPTYLNRLELELASKGVTEASVKFSQGTAKPKVRN
mmetsp:Transcript_507/g.1248  ORF Transcript_507/g.1248 Transcript_507/m.1248 type:complete len:437 (-) Transcript_507:424-1734(-)|eukprot:CAMPEP_0171500510 /NCGR_PEP_ID=MMETSP0958-20121227/9026_1 /TAXON_ID=87120 /ORGANISM="Aurantiochytrium limacinum, Strain ATCCMYA-1381" /LENGTH=436 /DNA_ID=CAMNT_0012035189 /DNA_START=412 /DNA_END=1722 /DNA_ORIENTATION=+